MKFDIAKVHLGGHRGLSIVDLPLYTNMVLEPSHLD